ncbi:Ku protein [Euzebya tangerina]|uniref:non-homologous end joining protein Ku n=1 Tax=Euzebya tangerina TaxID=591198 RepID=UPI0013C2C15B|nr:Ku protein [Euzebya tangerina]
MPRTLWKGTLSFGLVTIPVGLYTATENKSPSFNQLRRSDSSRIGYKRVAKVDDEPVSNDDIVKGFEYEKDRYVVFEKEELDALKPKSSRVIDIETFVPLSEIDPIYYDKPYYLGPEETGAKAYALLTQAMKEAQSVAMCRVTMRDKEHVAVLRLVERPVGGDGADGESEAVLVLNTMHWPDEIREFSLADVGIDEIPEPREAEVQMALSLIENYSGSFDPENYVDTYRSKVTEAVQAKVDGEEITVAETEEEPASVVDLMAALKASVERSKSAAADAGQEREAS